MRMNQKQMVTFFLCVQSGTFLSLHSNHGLQNIRECNGIFAHLFWLQHVFFRLSLVIMLKKLFDMKKTRNAWFSHQIDYDGWKFVSRPLFWRYFKCEHHIQWLFGNIIYGWQILCHIHKAVQMLSQNPEIFWFIRLRGKFAIDFRQCWFSIKAMRNE